MATIADERFALERRARNALNSYAEGYGTYGAHQSALAALRKHDEKHAPLLGGGTTVAVTAAQEACHHHWIPTAAGAMKCHCGARYVNGAAVLTTTITTTSAVEPRL